MREKKHLEKRDAMPVSFFVVLLQMTGKKKEPQGNGFLAALISPGSNESQGGGELKLLPGAIRCDFCLSICLRPPKSKWIPKLGQYDLNRRISPLQNLREKHRPAEGFSANSAE